jgi:NAD(P)-dependent dehydrogenase (short-subunit alcohol dehydrogenase family)
MSKTAAMSASFTTHKQRLTWLITGCSSGFGLSLTRFAQAGGHRVIASSRNPSASPDLVAEVESKGGKWIQLDVNNPESAQVIEDLEKSGHKIDVLVNNAGFCIFSPIETSAEEEHRSQMESMYFGPLRLIRTVLPHMRKRRFGTIVNMSSGAALDGNPSMGGYAGAKAGLDGMSIRNVYLHVSPNLHSYAGLTKVLAKEVAPFNIRALTVVLGTYNTNFGNSARFGQASRPDDYNGSVAEQMIQYIPGGKGKPNGDKDKAMKTVYEVVVGEGAGTGREAERFLPLGSDMTARVKIVLDYLAQGLEAFKEVTNNVSLGE